MNFRNSYAFGRAYRRPLLVLYGLFGILLVPSITFEVWYWRSGKPYWLFPTQATLNQPPGSNPQPGGGWVRSRDARIGLGMLAFFLPSAIYFRMLGTLKKQAEACNYRCCPGCLTPTADDEVPREGESCPACKHPYRDDDYREFVKYLKVHAKT